MSDLPTDPIFDPEDYSAPVPDLDTPPPFGVEVIRDDAATWLRRYAATRRRIALVEAPFTREIERLIALRAEAVGPHNRRAQSILDHLRRLTRALHRADPSVKTWRLPHGTLASRARPNRLVIENHDEALAWAKEYAPHTVRTVETVDVAAVARLVPADVEPPPGWARSLDTLDDDDDANRRSWTVTLANEEQEA